MNIIFGDELKAAIYLRLSRDDRNYRESESISGQRIFLTQYCKDKGYTIFDEYVDDGYSGTNFQRPGFVRMMEDAKNKRFSVIITKDMSRLGRDYIKTGEYIESYFPSLGIRYIAVNDNVDTGVDDGAHDMIPFKAVFNDMYSKDISRKVRSSLDARKKQGYFVGSSAPYGYKKSNVAKGSLEIDERCAFVVRRIFKDYISGKSMLSIAKSLTEEGVPTPSRMKYDKRHKSAHWNSVTIRRILSNPTYEGNLTQGFERKLSYKSKKRIKTKERIIVYSTHPPIVSADTFRKAENKMHKNK